MSDMFIKLDTDTNLVHVDVNGRALLDLDTIIHRNQDMYLKNTEKNKCLKIDTTTQIKMFCGPGGNVKYRENPNPDPNWDKLKMNPGSLEDPSKNRDGCGPLRAEPKPFHFAKDASPDDLYITLEMTDPSIFIDYIKIWWGGAVSSFIISCFDDIQDTW